MFIQKKAYKFQRHTVATSNPHEAAARTRTNGSDVVISVGDKHEIFISYDEWKAISDKVDREKIEAGERLAKGRRYITSRAIAGEYLNRFALALRDGKSPDECPYLRSHLPSIAIKLGLDIECLGGPRKFEEDAKEIIRDIIIGPGYESILSATRSRQQKLS